MWINFLCNYFYFYFVFLDILVFLSLFICLCQEKFVWININFQRYLIIFLDDLDLSIFPNKMGCDHIISFYWFFPTCYFLWVLLMKCVHVTSSRFQEWYYIIFILPPWLYGKKSKEIVIRNKNENEKTLRMAKK